MSKFRIGSSLVLRVIEGSWEHKVCRLSISLSEGAKVSAVQEGAALIHHLNHNAITVWALISSQLRAAGSLPL